MAPSIISHFRPHRRVGSTPSSPRPQQRPYSSTTASPAASQHPTFDSPPLASPDSYIPSQPPVLPPITRVTSGKEARKADTRGDPGVSDLAIVDRRPASSTALSYPLSRDATYVLPPIQRVTSGNEHDSPDTPTPVSAADDILEEKRKLSEPSPGQHPERLSARMSRTRASFADFGRTPTAPTFEHPIESSKPPATPSTSSQHHGDPPLLHPHTHQVSSPASSMSSFHKAASSTNLAVESSPASSKSAQGSTERTPAPSHRLSRGKFNLLNPVSLLKRRRTSQVLESPVETPIIPTRSMDLPVMRLPVDYDPRIKGKGVHDFDDGARPKRNHSANDMPDMATDSRTHMNDTKRRSSIPALRDEFRNENGECAQEKEHAPVFVEHFEEEDTEQSVGVSAVQRESLANSQFLARMSKQLDFDSLELSSPCAPTKMLVDSTPTHPAVPLSSKSPGTPTPHQPSSNQSSTNARHSKNTDYSSVRISSDQSTARSSTSNETKATSPPQSPQLSNRHQQTRSLDAPFQPSPNLSHLPSTASRVSRFSFQLNSDHSVEQEKALEEKHKRKHESQEATHDPRFDEFDEEGIDYDYMLDDAGFEEDIPTMGGEDDVHAAASGLGNQRLSSFNTGSGNPAIDVTRASSYSHYTDQSTNDAEPDPSVPAPPSLQGLGLENVYPPLQADAAQMRSSDFGDMYFDDGIIQGSPSGGEQEAFDESALDSPIQSRLDAEPTSEEFPTPRRRPEVADEKSHHLWTSPSAHVDEKQDSSSPALNEETTPTKPAIARGSQEQQQQQQQQQQQHTLNPEFGLSAYHNALAEAATQAARDGKFSRQNSVMTASSVYSFNPSLPDVPGDADVYGVGDDILNSQQEFDEADYEDDLFVAEANADALASEDSDFYGHEFGFYRNPNETGDGQIYNGGYFGQPNLLGSSLRNREPNLTPITERSEYSTRNSIIGGTPWGPPSSGAWGPSPSTSQAGVASPGLKDIAASMGMDDEEMTLSQLLRLRKEAFGSGMASGGHSARVSTSSNESSPTSQQNSSPLAGRSHASSLGPLFGAADGQRRRSSDLELPQVREAPESVESGEDSPISDHVVLGTAKAVLCNSRAHQREGSSERLAQEYSSMLSVDSPVPTIAEPIRPTPPTSPSQPVFNAPTTAGPSSPPFIASPKPQRASMGLGVMQTPAPKASSPLTSPPVSNEGTFSLESVPSPPAALMQKFAQRPGPDAYRKSGQPSQMPQGRRQSSMDGSAAGASSVAYVRDIDEDDGVEKWFLERRHRKSTGELIVIGREPVESGRI